jgi:hypothetical protein
MGVAYFGALQGLYNYAEEAQSEELETKNQWLEDQCYCYVVKDMPLNASRIALDHSYKIML